MFIGWTRHLKDPVEKDRFEKSILSSKPVLNRLKEMLDGFETSLDYSEQTVKAYENPSWAYLQADKNGYRRCLAQIKEIIDLDKESFSKELNDR